jgi:hypothetical protein
MAREFPVTIAYDMTTKKPGCAILQGVYGGTVNSFDLQRFDVENWLLAPNENIKLYTLKSEEELEAAIKITKEANGKK